MDKNPRVISRGQGQGQPGNRGLLTVKEPPVHLANPQIHPIPHLWCWGDRLCHIRAVPARAVLTADMEVTAPSNEVQTAAQSNVLGGDLAVTVWGLWGHEFPVGLSLSLPSCEVCYRGNGGQRPDGKRCPHAGCRWLGSYRPRRRWAASAVGSDHSAHPLRSGLS